MDIRNVPTKLILLEIAKGLQDLAKNPDLNQMIKDAYALSESEKQKAQDARDLISKSDAFLAELKQKEDAFKDAESRVAEAKAIEESNANFSKIMSQKKAELEAQESKNAAIASANEIERIRLEKFADSLNERENSIGIAEAEIKKMRDHFKKKAEKLKAETADL